MCALCTMLQCMVRVAWLVACCRACCTQVHHDKQARQRSTAMPHQAVQLLLHVYHPGTHEQYGMEW